MSTSFPPRKKLKEDSAPTYLQGWDEVYSCGKDEPQNAWGRFHKQWWGPSATGKVSLDVEGHALKEFTIQVDEHDIWDNFRLLKHSNGWMIVRDEYVGIYDRLSRLFELGRSGAVLTGQPGIGKSYFAIYALLRRMTEGKTTLYTTSHGVSYLFHETGIRCKGKAQVAVKDLPRDPASPAWSLIDAAADGGAEVSELTSPALFVLITCSPKEERYKDWKKQQSGLLWVMNPWTEEELHVLFSNPAFTKLSNDERNRHITNNSESVQKLIDDVGPCPRDILRFIMSPIQYDSDIENVLMELDMDKLVTLFRVSIQSPNSTSHRLTLLSRTNDLELLDGDKCVVKFKSHEIRKKVMRFFKYLSLEDRKHLFQASSSFPAGSWLAGWTFEGLANEYIRGARMEWSSVFQHFACMVAIKPTTKWPHRFQHCPSGSNVSSQLEVSNDLFESQLSGLLEQPYHQLCQTAATQLPIYRRNMLICTLDIESLLLSTEYWYCPEKCNNPAFDSFFLQDSGENMVLWVFQMTIAKIHDGKVSGFKILDVLKKKVASTFKKSVIVNLVLVTCYIEEQVVKWNLPKEWENHHDKGLVYVQYLDLRKES